MMLGTHSKCSSADRASDRDRNQVGYGMKLSELATQILSLF